MTRHELVDGHISVTYGCDHVTGFFLSIEDRRLRYESSADKAVNDVTESIGIKDGSGSYFDLHTGPAGFGIKVTNTVYAEFLRRYGVPTEHVEMAKKGKKF
jgi:hypothetical protein